MGWPNDSGRWESIISAAFLEKRDRKLAWLGQRNQDEFRRHIRPERSACASRERRTLPQPGYHPAPASSFKRRLGPIFSPRQSNEAPRRLYARSFAIPECPTEPHSPRPSTPHRAVNLIIIALESRHSMLYIKPGFSSPFPCRTEHRLGMGHSMASWSYNRLASKQE